MATPAPAPSDVFVAAESLGEVSDRLPAVLAFDAS